MLPKSRPRTSPLGCPELLVRPYGYLDRHCDLHCCPGCSLFDNSCEYERNSDAKARLAPVDEVRARTVSGCRRLHLATRSILACFPVGRCCQPGKFCHWFCRPLCPDCCLDDYYPSSDGPNHRLQLNGSARDMMGLSVWSLLSAGCRPLSPLRCAESPKGFTHQRRQQTVPSGPVARTRRLSPCDVG